MTREASIHGRCRVRMTHASSATSRAASTSVALPKAFSRTGPQTGQCSSG